VNRGRSARLDGQVFFLRPLAQVTRERLDGGVLAEDRGRQRAVELDGYLADEAGGGDRVETQPAEALADVNRARRRRLK
jgi:hypothetical protein